MDRKQEKIKKSTFLVNSFHVDGRLFKGHPFPAKETYTPNLQVAKLKDDLRQQLPRSVG